MRVIVAGSRDFNNYQTLEDYIDSLEWPITTIVSGGAIGADRLGELYANNRELNITRHIPDWNKYGKSAGYRRNALMAEDAEGCIVFWDGESKGSKHMIDLATDRGLKVKVLKYKED